MAENYRIPSNANPHATHPRASIDPALGYCATEEELADERSPDALRQRILTVACDMQTLALAFGICERRNAVTAADHLRGMIGALAGEEAALMRELIGR